MFKRIPYLDARKRGAVNHDLISQLLQDLNHADLLTLENTQEHIATGYSFRS